MSPKNPTPRNLLLKNQRGQSVVEFLVGSIFVFTFVFAITKIVFIFGEGHILHYATFEASRAFLTYDFNSNDPINPARAHARNVFTRYIKNGSLLKINNPPFNVSGHFVGAQATYGIKFPFAGQGPSGKIFLHSESFLGKEPTRSYCHRQILRVMARQGPPTDWQKHITLFDNGC